MTDDGTTSLPDRVVDADDPWFHFVYDDSWRIVVTYRADHAGAWTIDSDAKERFVYHNAGLDGFGGSSYIDAVILRERDADNTGGWAASPDGTLEERTYCVQNWRADVVALFTDAGALIQQVRYDPYGVPLGIPKTDVTGDGIVDTQDLLRWVGSDIYNGGAGTHPYADWDLDGDVDAADQTAYTSDCSADTSLGRGVLGYEFDRVGGNNRKGYAGYEVAIELEIARPGTHHVRHRVYIAELGRWSRRDPLEYVDGPNFYLMGGAIPLIGTDWDGLAYASGGGGCAIGCGGGGDGESGAPLAWSPGPKLTSPNPNPWYSFDCPDKPKNWPRDFEPGEPVPDRVALCREYASCRAVNATKGGGPPCYQAAYYAAYQCCIRTNTTDRECAKKVHKAVVNCRRPGAFNPLTCYSDCMDASFSACAAACGGLGVKAGLLGCLIQAKGQPHASALCALAFGIPCLDCMYGLHVGCTLGCGAPYPITPWGLLA